jgi:hypothetical protein
VATTAITNQSSKGKRIVKRNVPKSPPVKSESTDEGGNNKETNQGQHESTKVEHSESSKESIKVTVKREECGEQCLPDNASDSLSSCPASSESGFDEPSEITSTGSTGHISDSDSCGQSKDSDNESIEIQINIEPIKCKLIDTKSIRKSNQSNDACN